jgi:alkaline phosphatase D
MKAIFYAVGPDIRSGFTIDEPFGNIHVYPLIAKILGLKSCAVDGRPDVLEKILRPQPKKGL